MLNSLGRDFPIGFLDALSISQGKIKALLLSFPDEADEEDDVAQIGTPRPESLVGVSFGGGA